MPTSWNPATKVLTLDETLENPGDGPAAVGFDVPTPGAVVFPGALPGGAMLRVEPLDPPPHPADASYWWKTLDGLPGLRIDRAKGGDVDGDGDVDGADAGLAQAGDPRADLDGDGDVDGADLGIVLGRWNTPEPTLAAGLVDPSQMIGGGSQQVTYSPALVGLSSSGDEAGLFRCRLLLSPRTRLVVKGSVNLAGVVAS